MASRSHPIVKAFDADEIHAGNFALTIDHERASSETDALLASMSLAQKIHEIRGLQPQPIDSLYYAGGDERLGIAPWKMVDGPRGTRVEPATAFPVAIARAASFDVALERRVGLAIGLETAAHGGNVLLAPTINLLRHPGWGRAQETYSEDPHHTGAMGAAFVSGVQNHVLTSPKHFALNNLENTRFELTAEIDGRTLRELYLPHFERCVVEAGAASVMSAYNRVNGVYCGENPELLDTILRGEWGFAGFVESDWFLGTRSTAPAIRAGMDIEMPAGFQFSDEKIEAALAAGEIDEETIERNARRSLYQKVAWQLAEDAVAGRKRPGREVIECDAHVDLAREAAEKSIVLLKNEAEVLPLARGEGVSIAVVGDLADTPNLGDRGSSMVTSSRVTNPLEGIRAAARGARVEFFATDADFERLAGFDVAVVVAGLTYRDEGEFIPIQQEHAEDAPFARGGDRADLALPEAQRRLVERASAAAKRTVVVLQGGSAILVNDWIGRVDGLLMAWYGGREGGHGLARVLFGEVSPGGRLPMAWPKAMDQLMDWDVQALELPHDLLHGYRWLDHHGIEPEFPFGFGLGYTSFALSDLSIEHRGDRFLVHVGVRNAGGCRGATVPQLYVSCRDSRVFRVPKELVGFGRVELDPGEAATLELEVMDRDLRFYDADEGRWELEACGYDFRLGQSSADADLPLEQSWRYDGSRWEPVTG